jgi:predicted adenylyl cyclase CyaB
VSEENPRRANVELKARYPDRDRGREVAERLGARRVSVEVQTDTYFSTGAYRMKLRESSLGRHWLIGYSRPDRTGSRKSSYRLLPVPDPAEKRRILATSMGVKATVVKERELWLLGPTRIHLDRVEGLGDFLEFEVVMEDGLTEEEGHRIVRELRAEFGIADEDVIAGSYSDLVLSAVPR